MQLSVKNILYSTDLSHNAPIAFGYAAYLAKLTGADIHILHVLEPLSDDAVFALQVYVQSEKNRHEMLDLRIERAQKLLDEKQDAFWAGQSDEDKKVRAKIKSTKVCESKSGASSTRRSTTGRLARVAPARSSAAMVPRDPMLCART